MLVMQILNKGKDGINRIYNVKVDLKNATKVKENTTLKGFEEEDVIVNGSSFKKSVFNTKNQESNVVVNFIRGKKMHTDKKDFIITTRSNSNSTLYDLYSVAMPPKKVTTGLDNLYGKAIIDMQKEIPNINKGKYVSLKDLGVCDHIDEDRTNLLKYIVNQAKSEEDLDYMLLANNLGDLKSTIDFLKLFNFTIISEATVEEKQMTDLIDSMKYICSRDSKSLKRYYQIAKDNKECYEKLSKLNKIIYGKSIGLIHSRNKSKVLVKDRIVRDNDRYAA